MFLVIQTLCTPCLLKLTVFAGIASTGIGKFPEQCWQLVLWK